MDAGITLLGLGPGDPGLLTRQAWEALEGASEIYLRTRQHPTVAGFPKSWRVRSFDRLYRAGQTFEEVYERIAARVLELGRRPQGVVYAVPGHPFVAEATCPEIARRARAAGIPLRVVEGLSFLEAVFAALETDPFPHTNLVDALELAAAHHPPFPPSVPTVIAQLHSRPLASEVKLTLMAVFPDDHPVRLVHRAGTPEARIESLPLYEIDRSPHVGLLTCLYLPPLAKAASFESFQELVAHLRAPEGCPWDREQTHQSLRPFLMEEAYEVLAALDSEDPQALKEELGDLLLQVVLHTQIGSEYGEFGMPEVLESVTAKLVRRHPHVFGDLEVEGKEEVLRNWERLKAEEREENEEGTAGLLHGIPLALPALSQADAYQRRAARVGFDWPELQGVLEKVTEELDEVRRASGPEEQAREVGDLLFSLVNLARRLNVDAESALRAANARFRRRFEKIEAAANEQGRPLSALTLQEMDALWEAAKGEE